ncbi:potassium-transporting ATPase subunit KdpC [Bacillota bacterium LX-D]|nr:potassium-transporting ATPase subunit KdpC [Bacillota bacterium LX-D]
MIKALRLSLVLLVICGLLYPLGMTGIAQLLMPYQADGSLMKDANGNVVGSELIGQSFKDPRYFTGRVSSIDYNAAGSGSGNLAPSNPALIERVQKDIDAFLAANPGAKKEDIPGDLLTNSGSGLDPHISPLAAKIQVPRISRARGIPEERLNALIDVHTEGRQLGVFGQPRVNVVKLNQALDAIR